MALWQGVKPALVLVTNPVIQFTVFEQLKTLLEKRIKRLKGWHFFLLGALSKLIATASTYPYMYEFYAHVCVLMRCVQCSKISDAIEAKAAATTVD